MARQKQQPAGTGFRRTQVSSCLKQHQALFRARRGWVRSVLP